MFQQVLFAVQFFDSVPLALIVSLNDLREWGKALGWLNLVLEKQKWDKVPFFSPQVEHTYCTFCCFISWKNTLSERYAISYHLQYDLSASRAKNLYSQKLRRLRVHCLSEGQYWCIILNTRICLEPVSCFLITSSVIGFPPFMSTILSTLSISSASDAEFPNTPTDRRWVAKAMMESICLGDIASNTASLVHLIWGFAANAMSCGQCSSIVARASSIKTNHHQQDVLHYFSARLWKQK